MAEEPKKKKGGAKLFIATHLMAASIGVFVLVLLAGYFLLFAPELNRIRNANVTKSLEEERQAKTAYLSSLDELAKKYSELDPAKIENLKTLVPDADDVPALLAMIEASALTSDISLLGINFAKGEPDGTAAGIQGIGTMNITLNLANASYSRFKLFLEALESNLRLFDIRSMDINPSGATYTLSIRAYVRS